MIIPEEIMIRYTLIGRLMMLPRPISFRQKHTGKKAKWIKQNLPIRKLLMSINLVNAGIRGDGFGDRRKSR
jgi:hypothetical protein